MPRKTKQNNQLDHARQSKKLHLARDEDIEWEVDTSDDEILIFDYDNNHLDKDIDPNGGKGKMKASAYNEMMYTAANCD